MERKTNEPNIMTKTKMRDREEEKPRRAKAGMALKMADYSITFVYGFLSHR